MGILEKTHRQPHTLNEENEKSNPALHSNFLQPYSYNSAYLKYKIGNDCQYEFHINTLSTHFRMFYVF